MLPLGRCQSGPESDGNDGVFRIIQIPSITGASPSDCLMSYPENSLGESYTFAEMLWVFQQPQPTGSTHIFWNLFSCRRPRIFNNVFISGVLPGLKARSLFYHFHCRSVSGSMLTNISYLKLCAVFVNFYYAIILDNNVHNVVKQYLTS